MGIHLIAVQIVEIMGRAAQGITLPFLCKGEI
jgi:hypothetical protein